jgi:hypothetical protein
MAGMNTQEDSEEEGDRIQSKKGRGKSKKGKKVKTLTISILDVQNNVYFVLMYYTALVWYSNLTHSG